MPFPFEVCCNNAMAQLQSFGGWAASILDGQEKGNTAGRPEEKGWGDGKRKMELVS